MFGVAAGVATLVIALAMNTGFRETLQDRLLGVTAHISLTRPGSGGIPNYQALAQQLAEIPGVRSVTPAIYQTVLLSFGGEARGMVTKGIDVALEEKTDEALQKLSAGHLDFSPDAEDIDGLLHRQATRRRVENAARRLRHADEPAGPIDAIRIDAAHPQISA